MTFPTPCCCGAGWTGVAGAGATGAAVSTGPDSKAAVGAGSKVSTGPDSIAPEAACGGQTTYAGMGNRARGRHQPDGHRLAIQFAEQTAAGDVRHSIPLGLRAVATIAPRIPGTDAVLAK